jgi:hypothetical protein
MASVQEPGLIRMYAMKPSGHKVQLLQARTEDLAPAGGAPDGAPASVATPEKRLVINSPVVMENDDILLVSFTPDGSDGLDASDAIWSIPVVTPSGSNQLGNAQFANPAYIDTTAALTAGREVIIAGYKVTEKFLRLSGKIFLDVQDDTA